MSETCQHQGWEHCMCDRCRTACAKTRRDLEERVEADIAEGNLPREWLADESSDRGSG